MFPTFIGLLFTNKYFVICFHSCFFNLIRFYALQDILAPVVLHIGQWLFLLLLLRDLGKRFLTLNVYLVCDCEALITC